MLLFTNSPILTLSTIFICMALTFGGPISDETDANKEITRDNAKNELAEAIAKYLGNISPESKQKIAKCVEKSSTEMAAEDCLSEVFRKRIDLRRIKVCNGPCAGPASSHPAGPKPGLGEKLVKWWQEQVKAAKDALHSATNFNPLG